MSYKITQANNSYDNDDDDGDDDNDDGDGDDGDYDVVRVPGTC